MIFNDYIEDLKLNGRLKSIEKVHYRLDVDGDLARATSGFYVLTAVQNSWQVIPDTEIFDNYNYYVEIDGEGRLIEYHVYDHTYQLSKIVKNNYKGDTLVSQEIDHKNDSSKIIKFTHSDDGKLVLKESHYIEGEELDYVFKNEYYATGQLKRKIKVDRDGNVEDIVLNKFDIEGNLIYKKTGYYETFYEYDFSGNLMKESETNQNGALTTKEYKYNDKGQLIEEKQLSHKESGELHREYLTKKTYNNKGEVQSSSMKTTTWHLEGTIGYGMHGEGSSSEEFINYLFIYNEQGKEIGREFRDDNGLRNLTTLTFDEKGNRVEKRSYSHIPPKINSFDKAIQVSRYNKNGDLSSIEYYDPNYNKKSVISCEYKYDSKNNWIERTCSWSLREDKYVTRRKIEYY